MRRTGGIEIVLNQQLTKWGDARQRRKLAPQASASASSATSALRDFKKSAGVPVNWQSPGVYRDRFGHRFVKDLSSLNAIVAIVGAPCRSRPKPLATVPELPQPTASQYLVRKSFGAGRRG